MTLVQGMQELTLSVFSWKDRKLAHSVAVALTSCLKLSQRAKKGITVLVTKFGETIMDTRINGVISQLRHIHFLKGTTEVETDAVASRRMTHSPNNGQRAEHEFHDICALAP